MSSILLDHSPLTPTRPSFARNGTPFLSKSQENILDTAVHTQSVSRPNSRRSSRIFAANLTPAREDSLSAGLSNYNHSLRAESPVTYDSPNLNLKSSRLPLTPARERESIANSWGVSSIGRGFDWTWSEEPAQMDTETGSDNYSENGDQVLPLPVSRSGTLLAIGRSLSSDVVPSIVHIGLQNSIKMTLSLSEGVLVPESQSQSLTQPATPSSLASSVPPSPRYRRRSSQKRFSLVSGRLSYTPPPSPPPDSSMPSRAPKLLRLASTSSFMSVNSAITGPPTPGKVHYAGDRSISEFVIQGDVGQGAYGLVKRGREVMSDGSYGVSRRFLLASLAR
jgi:hypothetical protein